MLTDNVDAIGQLKNPELVFGLVGAVGVPLEFFSQLLEEALSKYDYRVKRILVSKFLKSVQLEAPQPPEEATEYQRLDALMTRGNEFRKRLGGDALATLIAAEINSLRPPEKPGAMPQTAFIIRQLKNPEEVELLRTIYGSAFYLIGLYVPRAQREHRLKVDKGLTADEVKKIIERDEGEPNQWGQQLRGTFYRADAFIGFSGDSAETETLRADVKRLTDLIFGKPIITPTKDEFGMYFADAASLRSADLSRQVGAAILSPAGEILSVGMNDVPKSGGGLYWEGDPNDSRDFRRGFDYNDKMKRLILQEILEQTNPGWAALTESERTNLISAQAERLESARVMNLTEFGRAVHAEMEAISAAARNGIRIRGATLYTTTFPCHNCAKHIVASGISRVVYVEPYPKSMAIELHSDSIHLRDDPGKPGNKVRFDPFVGIAPRRYADLFSVTTLAGRRLRRKEKDGSVIKNPLGIRQKASTLSYIERESGAALAAQEFAKPPKQEGQDA